MAEHDESRDDAGLNDVAAVLSDLVSAFVATYQGGDPAIDDALASLAAAHSDAALEPLLGGDPSAMAALLAEDGTAGLLTDTVATEPRAFATNGQTAPPDSLADPPASVLLVDSETDAALRDALSSLLNRLL